MKQPALYIPHGGGPCFFMDWNPPDAWKGMARFLRGVSRMLPAKPDAIVVISSHWEEKEFTLAGNPHPGLIYDYSGFPPHTYELKYPAPGSPAIAAEAAELLKHADITARIDAERGFDHGVFIPFLLMFPEADIPVLPLSLKKGLTPQEHIAAGKALQPLREQNILIVGSGMSYHNLRRFGPEAASESKQFDDWLTHAACLPDAARNEALTHWNNAPAARTAHPREEHLLPLMVVAGAAGDDKGKAIFSEPVMGMQISAYGFGTV